MHGVRIAFYALSAVLHGLLLFTFAGNYFHGGTAGEAIVMNAMAVLIVWLGIRLLPRVPVWEKALVLLLSALPLAAVVWGLVQAIRRSAA